MKENVSYKPVGFKKPISIPASELSPGSACVRDVVTGHRYYIDSEASSKLHSIRFWEFVPEGTKSLVLNVRLNLMPFIEPLGDEFEWVDGFCNDSCPWKEVALWASAGRAFQEAISSGVLSTTHKRIGGYKTLIAAMTCESPSHVPSLVGKVGIKKNEILSLASSFFDLCKSDWAIRIAVGVYLDFVPDKSIPIAMTREQLMDFASTKMGLK